MTNTELRAAFHTGLLVTIRLVVPLLILLLVASGLWAVRDYLIIRQQARNGQAAYQALLKAQQQQTQAPAGPTIRPNPAPPIP